MTTPPLSDRQYLKILQGLEEHHAIFYQLWEMGRPIFSDDVETASVGFDLQSQQLCFKFNPQFWARLSDYTRLFVIAHESLHVLLNHHSRSGGATDEDQRRLINIAMDVTVNTLLIKRFGFRRQKLDDLISQQGCFKDTVFGDEKELKYEHFEYFYRQLDPAAHSELFLFDDHDDLDHIPETVVDDFARRAGRRLSRREIDEVNQALRHSSDGDYTPVATIVVPPEQVDDSPGWADVIDQWVQRHIPTTELEERWDQPPRRLQSMDQSFFIPREKLVEDFDKPRVVFYLDTSGSCYKFSRRFMRCIDSIPRNLFDIDLYCFDTRVHPIDLKERKLTGYGGTAFSPLEYELRRKVRTEGAVYPEAVFVLTDGYGNQVAPKYPERWHWFLTDNGTDEYIPQESHQHWLQNFEN